MAPLLEVALNGARFPAEHPAIPRQPSELARSARDAVDGGAQVVHLHAFDDNGHETLAPDACAAALRAVRDVCPGIPLSLTTTADIEPDPARRLELVSAWTELPDLVTANQGEAWIAEVCDVLIARGVGIEAGLLCLHDAQTFIRSAVAGRCVRVLIEPLDLQPEAAIEHAAQMEAV